ncbi:hypothetical protein BD779DRAFT_251481 [Infundibulicybe gibba]|nr:hypothetical protein BD779DRAFT_251481 [Infundibulicybe gibba]
MHFKLFYITRTGTAYKRRNSSLWHRSPPRIESLTMDTSVSDARDLRIHGCLVVFAITFLYYDHLITMDREVKYLWARPKKPSTYLFLFNRYFLFSESIVELFFEFTTSNLEGLGSLSTRLDDELISQTASSKLQGLQPVTAAFPYGSGLMTLRVYALYGCSYQILGGMVVVVVVLFTFACTALFSQKTTVVQPASACHVGLSYENSIRLVATWESLFAYDSMVFALTLIKTWRDGWNIKIRARRLTVITLLFRDGTIYFGVTALANLANILTFYFCGPHLRGGLSTFSSSISVTMLSRFMLNLHETTNIGIFSTHVDALDRSQLNYLDDLVESGLSLPRARENIGGGRAEDAR